MKGGSLRELRSLSPTMWRDLLGRVLVLAENRDDAWRQLERGGYV